MVVKDANAARVLADPDARRFLEPFLGRERSARDAAHDLGENLDRVLARVRRFLRVGLLCITRQEPRAGRAVKFYRTVADGFFIPYGATEFESFESWFVAEFARREESLALSVSKEALAWGASRGHHTVGKRVFRRADGSLGADFAFGPQDELDLLHPAAPAIAYTFAFTDLDHESAKDLQRELLTLAEKYGGRRGGQLYSVRLALAPVRPE
ncbi:hypothetical protein DES52_110177 [Deinococcus yavapaiensis KR-236]|uniref:Uncharacterized protein n=2 Tax=Deinococcus TaxID=1298 RepID=A0A318S9Q4_9DEIO|nr:hypothetical protein DES52_110177 [Deinococcus yavapaiensis KR-236]